MWSPALERPPYLAAAPGLGNGGASLDCCARQNPAAVLTFFARWPLFFMVSLTPRLLTQRA